MSWENVLKRGVGLTRVESRLITSVMSDGIPRTYDKIMDDIYNKKTGKGKKYRWSAGRPETNSYLNRYYDKTLVGRDEFRRPIYEYSRKG